MDLKSSIQSQDCLERCRCLVRFHNCTPDRVTPYWIDFKGQPTKYSTLDIGKSINIDTYSNHLWFFMQDKPTTMDHDRRDSSDNHKTKILAIPEDSIDVSAIKTGGCLETMNSNEHERIQTIRNILVCPLYCSLCKYLVSKHLLKPNQMLCPHLSGESKFTVSDFDARTYSSDFSYIYSCSNEAHRQDHSTKRRNIYLVRSVRNLRELCFIKLNNSAGLSSIESLNLPKSLEREYVQFVTSWKRLDRMKT